MLPALEEVIFQVAPAVGPDKVSVPVPAVKFEIFEKVEVIPIAILPLFEPFTTQAWPIFRPTIVPLFVELPLISVIFPGDVILPTPVVLEVVCRSTVIADK